MAAPGFRCVVATSDLSDNSIDGLRQAANVASEADKLYILHAVAPAELLLSRDYGLGLEVTKQALRQIHTVAEQRMKKQWDAACPKNYSGPVPRFMTVDGSPAEEISNFAESVKADLLVIGTHGRTGFSHLLIGSVAENVVRHAPCAVLTVRYTAKQKKKK